MLIASNSENRHGRIAVRIHDITLDYWQQYLEIIVSLTGIRLPFITLPKARGTNEPFSRCSATFF
ncbi:hypothetical protein [Propionivibrio sp.]|uniref:hypothetical protein n=1 Tax=Propionivibrio sp. TaxID=2212460 RepID=UPI003BF1E81B